MKAMEVTFWTEGGTLVTGELVNPHTILAHDESGTTLDIMRKGNVVDVVSDMDGQLCAFRVPVSRIRYLQPIEVAA